MLGLEAATSRLRPALESSAGVVDGIRCRLVLRASVGDEVHASREDDEDDEAYSHPHDLGLMACVNGKKS